MTSSSTSSDSQQHGGATWTNMHTSDIKFTHDSIGSPFTDGRPVEQLTEELVRGDVHSRSITPLVLMIYVGLREQRQPAASSQQTLSLYRRLVALDARLIQQVCVGLRLTHRGAIGTSRLRTSNSSSYHA